MGWGKFFADHWSDILQNLFALLSLVVSLVALGKVTKIQKDISITKKTIQKNKIGDNFYTEGDLSGK